MQTCIYPATTDIVQDNIKPGASVSGTMDHYIDTHSVLETKEKDDAISAGILISNSSSFGQNRTVFESGRLWSWVR
jgi:hypothetical protein